LRRNRVEWGYEAPPTKVVPLIARSADAAAHGAAYYAAASLIVGKSCGSDADCDTGSSEFVGSCHIYYQVGQCGVVDLTPLPAGPQPPPQPLASCADFTCASSSYQCSVEVSTNGIACVLNRCSVNSGGGGGRVL
jgi:hypothetical protein